MSPILIQNSFFKSKRHIGSIKTVIYETNSPINHPSNQLTFDLRIDSPSSPASINFKVFAVKDQRSKILTLSNVNKHRR